MPDQPKTVKKKSAFNFQPLLRFLASLRLAVIVIVSIGVISAIGTIYEARYDAEVAQKLVYHSIWMYIIMGTLCVNLTAVMISRWPWKEHHAGFVLAHIGIMILLAGSLLTQKFGVDGSMAFEVGQERRQVVVKDRDLVIYSSLDGNSMRAIYETETDFLRNPPSEKKPFKINLGGDELSFIEYLHFAYRESQIEESSALNDGPAVRFQLENPNVNVTQWLRRDSRRSTVDTDLGPARVVLSDSATPASGRNEIILIPVGPKTMRYLIYSKDGSLKSRGEIKQSETIETGWMGLKFRLLRYLPHSRESVRYVKAQNASPTATSAVRFKFRGEEYWLGLNATLRIYLNDRAYILSYGNRQIELPFGLKLTKFTIGKYEGTDRASSYASDVEVPGRGNVHISMNEPLQFEGFTFYQSSFERNERGEAVVSVLSVNHDPGRWIKYAGSLLIVLGSIILFYFKRTHWLKKGSSK